MRPGGAALLAVLAALFGAPLAAAGAAPNQLVAPAVSPPSGTTSTSFVFSVRYVSADGLAAATSVTAQVAGLALPMALVAGVPTDGVWQATAQLPAGSWPVVFSAVPERGPKPSIDGPAVTVSPAPPPPPPATPAPPPAAQAPSQPPPAGGGGAVAPAPATPAPAAPAPATQPAPAFDPPAAADDATTTPSSPGPSRAAPASAAASTAPSASEKAAAQGAAATASRSGTVAAGRMAGGGVRGNETEDVAAAPAGGETADGTPISVAVGGTAAALLAVLGAWLLHARRSRPAPASGPAAGPEAVSEQQLPIAQRRMLRRARMRLDDEDPIVASLGIGRRPAPGSQVGRGPGERTRPPRSLRRPWIRTR